MLNFLLLLVFSHINGRVIVALACGQVAIFKRNSEGEWDLSQYHLVQIGLPHQSVRQLAVVGDKVSISMDDILLSTYLNILSIFPVISVILFILMTAYSLHQFIISISFEYTLCCVNVFECVILFLELICNKLIFSYI